MAMRLGQVNIHVHALVHSHIVHVASELLLLRSNMYIRGAT